MSEAVTSRRAMYLLGFFTFLNIINFVDRNLIIGFSPAIIEELNLTNAQYGLLTGLVFTFFYTFVGLGLGMLADRFHRPRIIAIGLFAWSLMTAASGAARNFVQMGAARLFVGAGEATLTPTALSILSDVLPPSRRAMASGVYYMGVPVGTGAGLVFAGILGPKIGWRNSFYMMGIVGVVLSAVVLLIKDPPRGAMEVTLDEEASTNVEAHESFGAVFRDLFGAMRVSPALVWAIIGCVITHIGLSATFFDIRWLVVERGFDQASAPLIVGGIYAVAGTLSTVFGGMMADKFHKRWDGGKLRFLVMCQVAAIPFGIAYRFTDPSHWPFYVCLFIGSMSLTLFYGPVFSAVQDLSPVRVRSTAIAFLLFSVNLIGIGGGAILTGILIDTLQTRGFEQPMTWGTLCFSLIGMTSSIAYLIAALYYRRSQERVAEVFSA